MRLNDDKINDIAYKLTDHLGGREKVRLLAPKNVVRARIARTIFEELKLEEDVVRTVIDKIDAMRSVKRGSDKWDQHFERIFSEEMAKRGRDWEMSATELHGF